MRWHACLIPLLILTTACVFAQSADYQRLTVEKGLINNMVLGTTQDHKGFTWFATLSGIDRFDGKSFQHFKLPVDSSKIYESTQITWIGRDRKGTVWISTRHELFRFDHAKKAFLLAYSYGSTNKPVQASAHFVDRDDFIWIATTAGLLLFPSDANSSSIVKVNNNVSNYGSIYQSSDGRVWAVLDNTISCYQRLQNKVEEIQTSFALPTTKNKSEIITLYIDRSSTAWLGSREHGVFAYDLAQRTWKSTSTINSRINGTAIRSISQYSKTGEILVATDGQGLFRIDSLTMQFKQDAYQPDLAGSISNNAIYHIYEDGFGRIWLSTFGGGVNLSTEKPPFQTFSHIINNSRSLYNDMGRSAVRDHKNRIWFGTSKGISVYNAAGNQWQYLSLDNNNQYSNGQNVLTLLNTGDGSIWAGTYGGGIKKISVNDLRITAEYETDASAASNSIGTNYIFSLFQDRQKRIWAGGIRGNLTVLDSTGKVIDQFPLRDIHAIAQDTGQQILLAGTNGLFQINYATKDVKKLLPEKDGVRLSFTSMCRIDEKQVALGTNGAGLYLYDLSSRSITGHFTEQDGLPSGFLSGMLLDSIGRLWISTINGLSCLHLKNQTVTNYTHADGLPGNQFNSRAYYKDPNGLMIFGGTNGFVLFDPEQFNSQRVPSKLVFSEFRLAHRTIVAGQENEILASDIDDTEELKLKHNQHSFSLDFITISPQGSEKNLYSWKLEGFDTSWSPVSANSTASYTNLDPGTYTLKIAALNNGLFNIGKERELIIRIQHPWYKTIWAYLGYAAIAILLAIALRKAIHISLARKRYQERIQFFSNIAHDLRTPLTLISTPINALINQNSLTEPDRNTLQLAERNANRLNRLVTQLLDFQKADLQKMRMLVSQHNVPLLLNDLLRSFQPLLDEKKLRLEFVSMEERLTVWLDQEKFEKIIYNLVSNAIKYSKPNGTITVVISIASASSYRIQISDNGIGIPERQQKHLFNQYYRANNTANLQETGSGLGLVLTKLLVELHKGDISFKSIENEGTTFTVELPLGDVFRNEEKLPVLNPEATNKTAPALSTSGKRKERLLVVEDNAELRHFLADSLSSTYSVLTATNGKEALKLTRDHDIHLIISDIMMPEMDGYTLCNKIKQATATCHIPVILLTAIQDEDYKMEGLEAGADDYVEKPFKMDYLKSRIENLLKTRELLKQKFYTTIDNTKITADSTTDGQFLHQAMEIVTENMGDSSFTIEQLCHSMAVSRPVLFRKIKSLTGLAPQDFIKNIRLKKAAELLLSKQHSISEISFLTGFGDAKYFSTSFKKQFGQTPSEYAKK